MEQIFGFRKDLLCIHETGIRDLKIVKKENEFFFNEKAKISIRKTAGELTRSASLDFADYMRVSMGVSASVVEDEKEADMIVCVAEEAGVDLEDVKDYRGFMIVTDENKISVYGHDERGVAQGLYYLEDIMTLNHAPSIPCGTIKRKPMYSPQMVHSAYGLDEFPDEYLSRIAHEGRDAILVFTKDLNLTPSGYLDFNDLIRRAAKYGIDVYSYSYMLSKFHPDDDGAEEYYESTYGKLFKECPNLRGVTLVGESVGFPSKDPDVGPWKPDRSGFNNIPTGKISPGWWPCKDYPELLALIKKVIHKYNSKADIVFWTYNWSLKEEKARTRLIETLPEGISVLSTFESGYFFEWENSKAVCADYTLACEGPGFSFTSEAEAASRSKKRLYSMTNTGGRTWDFGVVPYEPMPYQWLRRYENMREAYKKWGLCGIMECHHYGFFPSFITKLSKWCFFEPDGDYNEIAKKVISGHFGFENYNTVKEALIELSEAIRHFPATDQEQYGAFRVGPSYPFILDMELNIPEDPRAMFGNRIMYPTYCMWQSFSDTLNGIRIPDELKSLGEMAENVINAIALLKKVSVPNAKTDELLNLSHFILNTVKTGINAKKWFVLRSKMHIETERKKVEAIFDEMEKILIEERKNAEETIPLVENDSRLGWEPSMYYMTDKKRLEWKIRQVDYVLNSELKTFKECGHN